MHQQMSTQAESLTQELADSNEKLQSEVETRKSELQKLKEMETERATLQEELIAASREAGKAEIATGVLHNVGNVMNSVHVSAGILHDNLRQKLQTRISAAIELLQANADDLPAFFASAQGRQLLPFLSQLYEHSSDLLQEIDLLRDNVEHVNAVVDAQQAFATLSGIRTRVVLQDVVEASLQITNETFRQKSIEVIREYGEQIEVTIDKQKLIQVLVNLLRNAKHAIDDYPDAQLKVWVRVFMDGDEAVIEVQDGGVGIEGETLEKIFRNGFTTRVNSGGHGFGLHHSQCTLIEMGGSLEASSEGLHHGALFAVRLPFSNQHTNESENSLEFQAT